MGEVPILTQRGWPTILTLVASLEHTASVKRVGPHMEQRVSAVQAAAIVSAALLLAAGCGNPSPASSDTSAGQALTARPTSSAGPGTKQDSAPGRVGRSPRCGIASLAAHVVTSGAMMSQPFLVVWLTNRGTTRCHLRGYPAMAAAGHRAFTDDQTSPLPLTVHPGSIYERSDRGPQRIELSPRHRAFFALGTATAYQGGSHLFKITEFAITPPSSHVSMPLRVSVLASAPVNEPIPVGVTALQRGLPRP